MNWLKSIFKKEKQNKNDIDDSPVFRSRFGDVVEADEVFLARTSDDFNRMIKATELKTNPVDRHFLLQTIIAESYKKRSESQFKDYCLKYSEIHLKEFPEMITGLTKEFGSLPRVSVFQNYSTLLTELGQFEKAISVCEMAINNGLSDGTKGNYQGRIDRIKKKINK